MRDEEGGDGRRSSPNSLRAWGTESCLYGTESCLYGTEQLFVWHRNNCLYGASDPGMTHSNLTLYGPHTVQILTEKGLYKVE